jgi:hypothetical protein
MVDDALQVAFSLLIVPADPAIACGRLPSRARTIAGRQESFLPDVPNAQRSGDMRLPAHDIGDNDTGQRVRTKTMQRI